MIATMGEVTDYLGGLDASDASAVGRLYEIARELAPEAVEGMSYGMPALLLDGKPLLSVMRARAHIGIYPFSAAVVAAVADDVAGVAGTSLPKGTIRFQPTDPLPDGVVRAIVRTRIAQIRGQAAPGVLP